MIWLISTDVTVGTLNTYHLCLTNVYDYSRTEDQGNN
jgi:hypothetical protein